MKQRLACLIRLRIIKRCNYLNRLLPTFRGTDKAEKIAYMNAYCYYHERDYILANYQFKQICREFPNQSVR